MPFGTSRRIGCARPFQRLKSPTTLTRSAFGAHTAKYVPVDFADGQRMRAELLEGAIVIALAEQVQIELAHHLPVAIGIVDLADEALVLGDPQAIVEDALLAGELAPRR